MRRNPLIPKAPQPVKFISHDGSKGILDDYAVRKNIASKEGTIEQVPTDDNHIVNKKYVDDKFIKTFTEGEALTNGNICYLKSDGKMWKAKADAESTSSLLLGLRVSEGVFLLQGDYTDSSLTTGSIYYLSVSTGGAKTTTLPNTTGNIVRILGYATSTTNFYFNPDKTYVEVA